MRRYLTTIFLFLLFSIPAGAQVYINEVMSSNGSALQDSSGDYPDWIELYNSHDFAFNLEGYYLTDDANQMKWVFPEVTLEPGEFRIVFASGKDKFEAGELHTNFSISKAGEPLFLIDPIGFIVDRTEPITIPRDISYGRKPDGSDHWQFFKNPTPGASNNTEKGYDGIAGEPEFSHERGYYSSSFDLHLSTPDENAVIHYTLDGSEPDSTSPVYETPIRINDRSDVPNMISEINTARDWTPPQGNVNKIAVVRARVYRENTISGDVVTHSYIVDDKLENRYTFPVISLNIGKHHLFDYDTGMYVKGRRFDENRDPDLDILFHPANYRERGRAWERPVHIEMFDNEGRKALAQDAGVRIHGSGSRIWPRKSLRLYARRDYGPRYFEYPLFEDKPEVTRSKRILLRNSGQDWENTLFRDAFFQNLMREMDLERQGFTPAIVFINGEYWGVHNIRERVDKYFLEDNTGANPENIDMLTWNANVKEGDNLHYKEMMEILENDDITKPEVYEQVSNYMEIENYINYSISQLYIVNHDWPGNNIDYWRERIPVSKWRWILYDLDFGFGNTRGEDVIGFNSIEFATEEGNESWPNPDWSTFLLRTLLKNQDFRENFINRYADLLNTTFLTNNVIQRLDWFADRYHPELNEHIERWNKPENESAWNKQIQLMRSYAFERPYHVRNHILSHFDLDDTYELKLEADNPQLGYIALNTIDIIDLDEGWSGLYFKGVPVKLTAVPYEGAVFQGWSGDVKDNNRKIIVDPEGNIQLKAHFEPEENFEPPFTNPEPHILSHSSYRFNYWDAESEAGSFPDNMAFHQTLQQDPGLYVEMTGDWVLPYDRASRSRITGLGNEGVGFINTSQPQIKPGAGYVGAAVLALDTRDRENIRVSFNAGTVLPNRRTYGLMLQYRLGKHEAFRNVKDQYGEPLLYKSHPNSKENVEFRDIKLPERANDREYVQLRWKYHHLGGDNGPRAKVSLGDIVVMSDKMKEPETSENLLLVYPNPSRGIFRILLNEALNEDANLRIFNMSGRLVEEMVVNEGTTKSEFIDFSDYPRGVYFLHLSNSSVNLRCKAVFRSY